MSTKTRNIIRISILFCLLLLPIFCALAMAVDIQYSVLKKIAYFAVVLVLLAIPALFLKARTYFIVEGVFNFFFFPIDIASLYLNKQSTSTAFLNNIFATNPSEALELLGSLWQVVVVVVLLWGLYFILAFRVENKRLLPQKATKIILISAGVLFVIGLVAMLTLTIRNHKDRSAKDTLENAFDLVWMKLYKIYPYNLYLETIDILKLQHQQKQLQKQVESFSFGLTSKTSDEPELFILVIGETARYDHLGINGYERNTTPLLAQKSNLVSFDSAFSQANLTATSLPLLATRVTAEDPEQAYAEKSVGEAFQEAGFKAGWLTKQIPYPFVNRIMNQSDYAYFWSKGIDVVGNYDIDLVSKLREFTEDTLQFFVLHSLGCHFRYELRYPDSFKQFQPMFEGLVSYTAITEENRDKLVNAYDNGILYTDYFLSELIDYVDSLDRVAAVLYISDHGESFWDDERKLVLHGSYQIVDVEYHVPLLVWYSDEYKAKYPAKVSALHNNKSTLISSSVVFHSLLDLADIDMDSTLPKPAAIDNSRSICSPVLRRQDTIYIITGSGETVQHSFANSQILNLN